MNESALIKDSGKTSNLANMKKSNKKSVAVTSVTHTMSDMSNTLIHWQMFQTPRKEAFTVNTIIMDYIK